MAGIKNYRDLEIWQEAMDLCEDVYRLTDRFPQHEKYNLMGQMRRAVVSIPSNIAEGFVRRHPKEFRQFLSVSLGSLGELNTQLILSTRLGYVPLVESETYLSRMEILGKKITTFYRGVRL